MFSVQDIAKKNLSRTILALKQLHMMSMSVAQLRSKTAERDFKEAANLLKAYHDVANLFASYANVGKLVGHAFSERTIPALTTTRCAREERPEQEGGRMQGIVTRGRVRGVRGCGGRVVGEPARPRRRRRRPPGTWELASGTPDFRSARRAPW